MAEPKYRYRIPPCPAYDIPAMESWLEDLAAKGLHLSKDGFFGLFATFEEGPPKKERFRLEPTDRRNGLFSEEYDPEDEAVQMLHQMGWTYRARRGQFYIYSTDDPNAPELNTDPQVQALTMAALSKFQRESFLLSLLWLAFYTLIYWRKILLTSAVLLGSWAAALFCVLMVWMFLGKLQTMVTVHRYRKQLQNGAPLPHRTDYRRQGIRYLAASGVRKLLWAILIIAALMHILPALSESNYTPLEDRDYPFATLQDILPEAEIERKSGILDSQDYAWSDPIAPENHDFSEYADVTIDGKTHTCYLTVQYFRMARPWLARWMAAEMVSQSADDLLDRTLGRLLGNEPVILTPIEGIGADFCVYYREALPDPYIILQKDNVVLRLRYAPYDEAVKLEPEDLAQLILSQIQ